MEMNESTNILARDVEGSRLPQYAKATVSAALPQYSNQPQDRVRDAFMSGNYQLIKDLGIDKRKQDSLGGTQTLTNDEKMEQDIKKLTGLFQTFCYMSDPFDTIDDIQKTERIDHEKIVKEIASGQEFVYRNDGKRLKSDALISDDICQIDYMSEPFLPSEHHVTRTDWPGATENGPFLPSGSPQKFIADKSNSTGILKTLKEEILEEWDGCRIEVYRDEEELIVVEFDESSVDNKIALLAFMNIISKCNETIVQHKLVKVAEAWNLSKEGSVFFAFQPPWVHTRPETTFYALHPKESSYRDKFKNSLENDVFGTRC
eukprot:956895_1